MKSISKVLHISFSLTGGAGITLQHLNSRLNTYKLSSEILSLTEGNITKLIFKRPQLFIKALIDFYVVRTLRSRSLFTYFRSGDYLLNEVIFSDSKIIHLHWIPGALDIKSLFLLSKKFNRIVWTLHDTFPFTGGCHVIGSCKNIEDNCKKCPQARKIFWNGISNNRIMKTAIYNSIENLYFVAPSLRIKNEFLKAAPGLSSKVRYIPNLISSTLFRISTSQISEVFKDHLGINRDSFVIGIVVNDVRDKHKNIQYLNSILQEINLNNSRKVVAVVIGKNYGKASDMYIKYLGFVEQERLSDYINFFDINLSLSNYESFGNTIIEAGFCGVESIVSHASGMGEVLNNTGTGYIYNDLNELILKITKIKNENEKKNKEAIRNKFLEYYGEEEIINSYQDLYNLTP